MGNSGEPRGQLCLVRGRFRRHWSRRHRAFEATPEPELRSSSAAPSPHPFALGPVAGKRCCPHPPSPSGLVPPLPRCGRGARGESVCI